MPNTDRCPNCNALIVATDRFCPQCGEPLTEGGGAKLDSALSGGVNLAKPTAVEATTPAGAGGVSLTRPAPGEAAIPMAADGAYTIIEPHTIDELLTYCNERGMPLEKMRFFIGQDYKPPKAFGIYQDGDRYVVYKNKADGSRAVRYNGPDEAYAVRELYQKLLDECHARDIWPDGKPADYEEKRRRAQRQQRRTLAIIAIVIAVFIGLSIWMNYRAHSADGYYRFSDDALYYRYGDSWYYDDYYTDWVLISTLPYDDYDDYYIGSGYDSDWGYSDFRSSDTWSDIHDSHSSSSDYSSWDSGGTDWSSDW